jgi:tetratricopeptide (TPR) repeat protein
VFYNLGLTLRRLGRYPESIGAFIEATRLDPAATESWAELLETAMQSFDHDRFWRALDEIPGAYRDQARILGEEALGHMFLNGDLDAAAATLARAPVETNQYVLLWAVSQHALWRRDYRAAAEGFLHEEFVNTVTPSLGHGFAAAALQYGGHEAEAQALLDEGLALATEAAQAPRAANFAWPHMALARLLILADRPDEALASCNRATTILPLEKDKVHGAEMAYQCAWVNARAGQTGPAMDDLDSLFELGWALSPWTLHYDPDWDFLRGNPRFDAMATPPVSEESP